MSSTNLEKILGGVFIVKEGMEGAVEAEISSQPAIPGMNAAQSQFDKTFDQKALDTIISFSPKYKSSDIRKNPFAHDQLRTSAGVWSLLIDKKITNFEDACEHALALCRHWASEDTELEKLANLRQQRKVAKQVSSKVQIFVQGTEDYEVEQARLRWKDAVQRRNQITAEWNSYVNQTRKEYRELRSHKRTL